MSAVLRLGWHRPQKLPIIRYRFALPGEGAARVMIEKFAMPGGKAPSEFLDLNHTSKSVILVSLVIPKFASEPGRGLKASFGIGTLAP